MSILKKKTDTTSNPHAQQTPYAGFVDGVQVETAPHLLVVGPTGTGKSTRCLGPGALLWRGPRVVVSSKTDFLKLVVGHGIAARGPLYVMDMSGELGPGVDIDWLQGVSFQQVVADPTALLTDGVDQDDDALDMATLLMQMSTLGAGGGGGSSEAGAFWQTLSAQSLAALLIAGKLSGEGIDWSRRAASRVSGDSPDDDGPSWARAIELLRMDSEAESVHAADLEAKLVVDSKMRDSIMSTLSTALTPFLQRSVSGRGFERGYGKGKVVPFSPSMLESENGNEPTLAIIAGASGVGAGATVSTIEAIIRHWRRGVERGLDRVLLAIDEFSNTAPLPAENIARYVSEARGLGVALMAAVQSSDQMSLRYGKDAAGVIRGLFPAVLLLKGAPERDALESAAWLEGEADHWKVSIDHLGKESRSAERSARITPQSLLSPDLDHARLLLGGSAGKLTEIPGIWTFQKAA